MSLVKDKIHPTTKESDNLKNLKPFERKSSSTKTDVSKHTVTPPKTEAQVSPQAKALNENEATKNETTSNASEAIDKASSVAEKIAKVPEIGRAHV